MQVAGGSAGGFPCIAINEFSGNWDSTRVESTNTNGTSATNTTPAHSNNATSAGAALFIGGLSLGNSGGSMTITPDAAFTQTYENEAGGTSQAGSSIYRIVTGGTTDRAEWTVQLLATMDGVVRLLRIKRAGRLLRPNLATLLYTKDRRPISVSLQLVQEHSTINGRTMHRMLEQIRLPMPRLQYCQIADLSLPVLSQMTLVVQHQIMPFLRF